LLTVKALNRIRAADAIVHDALISAPIRALFPPDAVVIDAGKRGGSGTSASQDEINTILVSLARDGLKVVRLKGGDPLVFGRGSEEALALAAEGIAWELIPGISSANGAAATALVPLTHRAVSRSCTYVEGHERALHRLDWQALVALGGTWVFFMGKAAARDIARSLLLHGADPALPMAVIENASLATQTVRARTLGDVAAHGYVPQTDGPGLVIVGPTVALFHELHTLVEELNPHEHPVSDLSGLGA
jgi:uroporphyrin-III C-methyltransferase